MKKIICALLAVMMLLCGCGDVAQDNQDTPNSGNDSVVNNNGDDTPSDDVVLNTITVDNPLVWDDIPDPDVIRVGDTYYMVSTTMYYTPGVPIMKSTDLAHWELIGYVYDTLENNPRTNLYGEQNIYGQGSWAASIRYHDGYFYILFCAWDTGKSYIYKTADIENPDWVRYDFDRVFHDASLFFEDDGTPYIISGGGNVWITELEKDCSKVKDGGVDQLLFNTDICEGLDSAEGAHFYKINGKYYCLMISYGTPVEGIARCEICYRSDSLLDGWEGKVVLCDSMDYYGSGTAQGGVVETPQGDWYAIVFQDHGGVGRIPILQPVEWVDGWPIMGVDGKSAKTVEVLSTESEYSGNTFMANDEFDYDSNELSLYWQFNHSPDNKNWSVTTRESCYTITTSRVDPDIFHAKNTLTQRTEGPTCTHEVLLYTDGLNAGDYAGISAFQTFCGMVGARVDENGNTYAYFATMKRTNDNDFEIVKEEKIEQDYVYLRIEYRFSNIDENGIITTEDQCRFYYSLDGENWVKIGKAFQMIYDLDLFTGYRTGLYCYSTVEAGGHADFEYFHIVDANN